MMLVSSPTTGLESTPALAPPVDSSAVVVETGGIGEISRLDDVMSHPTSSARSIAETNKLNPEGSRANVVEITAPASCGTHGSPDAMTAGERSAKEHQPHMKEPHISTLYEKQDVMSKHFGVTQEQALRTQALLRLGVTDEDVKIAERLLASRLVGDNVSVYAFPEGKK